MNEEPFEPYWEKDGEKLFANFDASNIKTPMYIVDLGILESNLKILKKVKDKTGCKILLALKGFSMHSTFPLVSKYLDGVCASSLHEARLGREKFGKEVNTSGPAYSEKDVPGLLKYSDHLVFNSFGQWQRYKPSIQKSKKKIDIGIRINPQSKGAETELYNPCQPCSRMGVILAEFKPELLEGISGLHFHALCEQGAEELEIVLKEVEKKFGKYLSKMKWVNFGGGHHITRSDYNIDLLCKLVNDFKKKYKVQIYLEPGEAIALNTGILVGSVLDIIRNQMDIAVLDISAHCHMPDVLAMPFRPTIIGAGKPDEKKYTYRLGGPTCLSGDIIGDFSFDRPLKVGDKVVSVNQAIYSMVQNNTFNGVQLPSIATFDPKTKKIKIIREFGYEDYKDRLS